MRSVVLVLLLALLLLMAVHLVEASSVLSLRPVTVISSASAVVVPALSGSFSLLGRPTVSAAFMNQVLADSHSPAVGLGTALYADGVQTGIDPVFALAFFWHESSFGTQGVARLTYSLGNIRCTTGYACLDGFRAYPSWVAGAADWFALLVQVYLPAGRSTVATIVPVYAPATENDVAAYIAAVEHAVSLWRAGAASSRVSLY